jgi:hypothetical protein
MCAYMYSSSILLDEFFMKYDKTRGQRIHLYMKVIYNNYCRELHELLIERTLHLIIRYVILGTYNMPISLPL